MNFVDIKMSIFVRNISDNFNGAWICPFYKSYSETCDITLKRKIASTQR